MKYSTGRVAALRERAAAAGLKRLELYAHPDDWPAIKAMAEKLQRRRDRAAKKAANADVTGLPHAQTVELPPKPAGGRSELT